MGQDLLKLELGGPPKSGEKQQGGQEPKAPAPGEQSTSSDPEPLKDDGDSERESPTPPPSPERKLEPPKEENKPRMPPKEPPRRKEPPPKPQDPRFSEHELKDKASASLGNREERRVSFYSSRKVHSSSTFREGENESHALAHLRTSKTVPEHRSFFNNIQRSRHVEPHAIPEAVQG